MTVKIRDVIAAEEALEAAEAEYRRFNTDIDNWSAYESMDKRGKRTLNVTEAHFQRRDSRLLEIEVARRNLLAVKRAFIEEVLPGATL